MILRVAAIILCRLRKPVCFFHAAVRSEVRNAAGRLRVAATVFRPIVVCAMQMPCPVVVMPSEALPKRSRVRRALKGRNLAPNS
jgi:hypothetical protein